MVGGICQLLLIFHGLGEGIFFSLTLGELGEGISSAPCFGVLSRGRGLVRQWGIVYDLWFSGKGLEA